MASLSIGGHSIGPDAPPFIIAELSANHGHDLTRALALVDAAARAGAQAIKLQTYKPETMTLDLDRGPFAISDPRSPWAGRSLHDLYAEAHTPWEWHAPLFDRAADQGLAAFSSAFDATSVDFLESLDVPAYKVASFELTDTDLIRRIAATGKPLIMSTGMASLAEIEDAVATARQAGCRDLVLLCCTSAYPAQAQDARLNRIPVLKQAFGVEVGLSDHSLGLAIPAVAVALGASVIEKHLTMARADGGPDAGFSLEPDEFEAMVTTARDAHAALGTARFGAASGEAPSAPFRRSLYIVRDLEAGEVVDASDLRSIRPGGGLPVRERPAVEGLRVTRAVSRGTPVTWDLFK